MEWKDLLLFKASIMVDTTSSFRAWNIVNANVVFFSSVSCLYQGMGFCACVVENGVPVDILNVV